MSWAAFSKRLPWWLGPLAIVVVLGGFGLYTLWGVFLQPAAEYQNYLSPFYSPQLPSPWAWLSPAVFVLWVPLGFRGSCYYYRKAYYRAFFWDPPACARREPRGENYKGERVAPWVWSNIHRYFLYAAIIVLAFLWYDTVLAFLPEGEFGVSVGSLVFLTNVVFLSLYTFSCHSLRHLIGGKMDCYSCVTGGQTRRKLYKGISVLNKRHSLWAWLSLFSVLAADIYVRLLLAGMITDIRLV